MTKYRFHQAAKDGYVEILREATSRESNSHDEDGMTPTLWAASRGNVEALRMLMTRGGDPNKCDILGNSALHHAAINGHIGCVSYLVQFGANLWTVDNNIHTAMDIAALNERMDIVGYLDGIVADQAAKNQKLVKKMRERAVIEAQKRIKEFKRLQDRAERRAEKEDRREHDMQQANQNASHVAADNQKKGIFSTLSKTFTKKKDYNNENIPRSYSEHFVINGNERPTVRSKSVAPVQKRASKAQGSRDFKIGAVDNTGSRSVKSLTGLKRDSEVMYMKNSVNKGASASHSLEAMFNTERASIAQSEPDLNHHDSGTDTGSDDRETPGIFDRPGFGSMSFFNRTAMSLPENKMVDDDIDEGVSSGPPDEADHTHQDDSSSIGSAGTLASRAHRSSNLVVSNTAWNEDVLEEEDEDSSSLELFLATCNLLDILPLLNKEKIDLPALMLCSDADLKEIGVPLGPRRKIISSIERRQEVLEVCGAMTDTRL